MAETVADPWVLVFMLVVLIALIVVTAVVLAGPRLRRGPSGEVERWQRAYEVMASWTVPPAVPLRAVDEAARAEQESEPRAA